MLWCTRPSPFFLHFDEFVLTVACFFLISRHHPHYPLPLCSTSRHIEFLALAFLTIVTVPLLPHVMDAGVDLKAQQNELPPCGGAFVPLPVAFR